MNRRSLIQALVMGGAGSFVKALGGDQSDYVIRSESRLVLLDVSVLDSKGQPVAGLSRENFHVWEDGKPRDVTAFDSDDRPVTLGVIVDESRSMTPKRADVLTAAEALMKESNPHDEIFVLNFNETVKAGLPGQTPFSDDLRQLHEALLRGVPAGRTALNDAVIAGLRHLKAGAHEKKTLVLISDGGDNASKNTRQQMLDTVQRSLATIYTIGVFSEDDIDQDPRILKKLAEISGGEAYFPPTAAATLPVCHRIAKDIRARYTVGYLPPPGPSERLRHVRVRAFAHGLGKLTTRTRTSYLYEAEDSTVK